MTACQASDPSLAEETILDALIAPIKAKMDAAVTAGDLSASDEADGLKTVRDKMAAWLTTPLTADQQAAPK